MRLFTLTACLLAAACPSARAADPELDLTAIRSGLVPKEEIGVPAFLERFPEYDGRGTVIAIFDSGVDPAAKGLQVTTTGERKIVDLIDGSGSGDVDTTRVRTLNPNEPLTGLSGRQLTLPGEVGDAEGRVRLGLAYAQDLFRGSVVKRLKEHRLETWRRERAALQAERARARAEAERAGERAFARKAEADRTLEEQDRLAREAQLEALEAAYLGEAAGPVFDCLTWQDGEHWRVIIDTDSDGDLAEEAVLRPFGVAGEYTVFPEPVSTSVAVQVYEDGDLLSLVTTGGSHGTHVAATAAGHFPEQPALNGIAPGARILSIKMGDVRVGGSNGLGELRATASAARHGVDLINASWGGGSVLQDGNELTNELYEQLTLTHGIAAFVSAGNNGPALSTTGSPGAEADFIIGVGAYVSEPMGRYLYNLIQENPETAFQFTSRGPTKGGDLGVDIMAPGAAVASLALESLRGSQRYNGTSMAAPSASGLGALLISGARQAGLQADPVRLRAALMAGARTLPKTEPFAQGAGLIQALPAWEALQQLQDEPAFDPFLVARVSGGTFSDRGRGLYLREPLDGTPRQVAVTVSPVYPDRIPDDARYAFDGDLVLEASQPWIQAPAYLRISGGDDFFRVYVDPPVEGEAGYQPLQHGQLVGYLPDNRAAGPVLRIPFTVVQPEQTDRFSDHRIQWQLTTEPGTSRRLWLQTPDAASRWQLRLERSPDAEDPLPKRFVVHAVSLTAERGFFAYDHLDYVWLKPGEVYEAALPTVPGAVTEVNLHQIWYSAGPTQLSVSLQADGGIVDEQTALLAAHDETVPVAFQTVRDGEVTFEAALDTAIHRLLPETVRRIPEGERGLRPAGPRIDKPDTPFFLEQTFTLKLEDPVTVEIGDIQPFDLIYRYGGWGYTFEHASGARLLVGSPWNPIPLPKGTTTITRRLFALDESLLKTAETWPLTLERKLNSPVGLATYPGLAAVAERTATGTTSVAANRRERLWLGDSARDALKDDKPEPLFYTGSLKLKGAGDKPFAEVDLRYFRGQPVEPEPIDVADPKPAPPEPPRDALHQAVFDRRLAFVREHRSSADPALLAYRDDLLQQLLVERPEDPQLLIEAAHTLVARYLEPDAGERDDPEEAGEQEQAPSVEEQQGAAASARQLLVVARRLADPDAVARWFGAPPVAPAGDVAARHAIEKEKKAFQERRSLIARSYALDTAISLAQQMPEAAGAALRELERWNVEDSVPAEEGARLETRHRQAQGLLGLAVERARAAVAEDPHNRELREALIDILDALDWTRFAEQERQRLARWDLAKPEPPEAPSEE